MIYGAKLSSSSALHRMERKPSNQGSQWHSELNVNVSSWEYLPLTYTFIAPTQLISSLKMIATLAQYEPGESSLAYRCTFRRSVLQISAKR